MGAAMRFIMSEPVPIENIMGSNPVKAAITVIILGRILLTAPSIIASFKSNFDRNKKQKPIDRLILFFF